jgi:hypothetical protein
MFFRKIFIYIIRLGTKRKRENINTDEKSQISVIVSNGNDRLACWHSFFFPFYFRLESWALSVL